MDALPLICLEGTIVEPGLHELPHDAGHVLRGVEGLRLVLGREGTALQDGVCRWARACGIDRAGLVDLSLDELVIAEAGLDGLVDVQEVGAVVP